MLDIAFSPNGEVLASANINGSVRLWDPETRRVHALLGHGSPVTTVAFGADKHTVITGSRDGLIRQWEVWDASDSAPEILTASTAAPLTESIIHGNVVTLTLSRLAFARSIFDIRDAVTVSGISGVIIPWHQPDRKNDTEITIKLEFNGNIDKDVILTFNVGANAVPGYFGPALTAQMPVTAFTELVTASTASPLAEASLDGSVVTLTLDGGTFARSRVDIGEAVKTSGVPGATVEWSDVDRLSDTEITVELGFNGDIDTDAVLTFSVGAGAIAGYGGSALTAQLPVTASMESVTVATASPLTERTLDGNIVTLTLNGRSFAKSIFDIRDGVTVSGVDGVTIPWHQPDRKSDTVITMTLEFNGDLDEDAALTFTVDAGAIAGYSGPALTVQLPVPTYIESVSASTETPLNEAALEGSVVTLTLTDCSYEQSIRDAVKLSGINGATVDRSNTARVSDTEVKVGIKFNGDMNADGTLTLTVGASAIEGYGGTPLMAQLPVTASTESLTVSTPAPLTESTLNGRTVTITLAGRTYARSIGDGVKVSGIAGVTIPWRGIDRKSDTEITIDLEFNGDIDTDSTLTFSVGADAIAGYGGPALSAQLPVTAHTESITASIESPLIESTLNGSAVTLNLNGRGFVESIWDIRRALKVSGIAGATIGDSNTKRVSDTAVVVAIEFNGDIDTDANLTFSVGKDAVANYNGPALTAQLPITASIESVTASTTSPSTEATLNESVITLTIAGRIYAPEWDIRNAVEVSGVRGVTTEKFDVDRVNDTEITVKLEFNGNINTDSTLTFTVGKDAIEGYSGLALAAQLPVTASTESVVASTASPLTEPTLNGSVVTLTLDGRAYAPVWDIRDAVKISGISGVTVDRFNRVSDSEVTVKLEFNGNIDTDANLTFSVGADAIEGYSGLTLTAQLPVTASTESVVASTASPLTEATLEGSVVALTLSGCTFARSIFDIRDAVTVAGIDGVTMPWHQPDRKSDTKITIELEFDGDMSAGGTLTFTVGSGAIKNYNGPALTAQLPVTASKEFALAPNFPNPFNPETWIPYQLAADADVTLTIHALGGELIRRLVLGHQAAGTYFSRSRAAYWDGKNDFGESVASGVYFYTLAAGDFSATRKMLIRK